MASLKKVKTRINSVQSARKIISAVKMVVSAELRKAQRAIESVLPYQRKLNKTLTNFLNAGLPVESPFCAERPVKRIAIVAFSSSSSLHGTFDANVLKMFSQTIGEYRELGQDNILVYPVGRKIEEAVKKLGFFSQGSYRELADKLSYNEAAASARLLMEPFLEKNIDRVELIHRHFRSMGVQELLRERYLPTDLSTIQNEGRKTRIVNDYITKSSTAQLIAGLISQVLSQKVFVAALDSNAPEHAAHTLAMQIATDNVNELIQELTRQCNKTCQQAITDELFDIVGGSMA